MNEQKNNNKDEINAMFAGSEEALSSDPALLQEMEAAGVDTEKVNFDVLTDADMKRLAESGAILEHQLQNDADEAKRAEIEAAEAEEEAASPKEYKKKKLEQAKQAKKLEKEKKKREFAQSPKAIGRTMLIFVLTFVVSALLGVAGTVYFLYREYVNPEWLYGYNASVAIENGLPKGQRFIPYEIYLKEYDTKMECVVFGEIRKKAGDYEDVHCRMSISKANPKEVLIYAPFDEEKYNALKNGTEEERIAAALMKEHDEIFNTEIIDMNRSKNDWIELKMGYIIAKLGPAGAGNQ
jgi:preprotein translocase subunit SecE